MRRLALTLLATGAFLPRAADAAGDPGAAIFAEHCVVCHQQDARGAAGVAPSLAGTLARHVNSAEGRRYLAQILVSGMVGPIETEGHRFSGLMPSFAARLGDAEIAATINHVLRAYNGIDDAGATTPISPADVAAARAAQPTPGATRSLRQSLPAPAGASAPLPPSTLYTWNCSGCHGADGHGVPEAGIPDLREAGRYLTATDGRRYLIQVPGLSQSRLDDDSAARILNWMLRRFSAASLPADFAPYTATEVARYRGDKASDARTRRELLLTELRDRAMIRPATAREDSAH